MEKTSLSIVKSKIGLKLLVPYLIISLLIFLLMIGLLYFNFETRIDFAQKIQEEISVKASSEIEFYINSIIEKLDLISKNIECVKCPNASEVDNGKMIKILMDADPSIYELALVDDSGKEVTKMVRYNPVASEILKDIPHQEKFIEAYSGKLYVGEYYMSDYQVPFLSVSFPIINKEKNVVGVLSSEIDLSPMWGIISKIKVKETGYVYVVDHTGDLIVYKDIRLVKQNLNLKDVEIVSDYLEGTKSESSFRTYDSFGASVIGNWKVVEATGWGVIAELPMKEIYGEMIPLFIVAGVSLAFSILFIVIILMIILKRILTPLSYLQQGVLEIEKGDLEYKIESKSDDEIGQLGEAFNLMTSKLKESYEGLERKVKIRTKELDKKNKELEEFTDVAIGREKRITELRNQLETAGIKPSIASVSTEEETKSKLDKNKK